MSATDVWAAGFSVRCQKTRQRQWEGSSRNLSPFPAHCVVWVYGTRRDAWRAIPGTASGAWEPLMAAINTSTCLWLHSYVVPQNTTRDLTGLTAVSPGPPFDSRSALVRSRCTCSSASRTRYIFYWRTFFINQETPRRSIKTGRLALVPTKPHGLESNFFLFWIVKGSNYKTEISSHKNMTNQNILFEQNHISEPEIPRLKRSH